MLTDDYELREIKLNEGDYVRTKYGSIGKITNLYKQFGQVEYQDNQTRCDTNESNILKSSSNIIDLIEVGDYVNGCLVSEIKDKWLILNYADIETYEQLERKNENIKSIVTKEQFEEMEFKVNG